MPARRAASALPPTGITWRPNCVRTRTNVQNRNSAADDHEHARDAAVLVADRDEARAARRRRAAMRRPTISGRLDRQARACARTRISLSWSTGVERDRRRSRAIHAAALDMKLLARPTMKLSCRITVPLVADEQQHDAVPGQQAGQRDDERRYADLRDQHAVQGADRRARARARARITTNVGGVFPSGLSMTARHARRRRRRRSRSTGRSRRAAARRRCPWRESRRARDWTIRLTKLPAVRKFEFCDWKTIAMMIRPRMIGSEPSSPLLDVGPPAAGVVAQAPSAGVGGAGGRDGGADRRRSYLHLLAGRGRARACRR